MAGWLSRIVGGPGAKVHLRAANCNLQRTMQEIPHQVGHRDREKYFLGRPRTLFSREPERRASPSRRLAFGRRNRLLDQINGVEPGGLWPDGGDDEHQTVPLAGAADCCSFCVCEGG